MTRQDYQLLASHIEMAVQGCDINERGVAWIADALEYDNCRFDRELFYEACGISIEGDA